MLVVDVFDERAIPPSSAESQEAERGSLRAFPCAEVGLTSASTHIVEHLVEGQPEVIAVFKVLPDVQIGPREMEAAGEPLVVVCRRVADAFRGISSEGSSRGVGRVEVEDDADLDALERGEAL